MNKISELVNFVNNNVNMHDVTIENVAQLSNDLKGHMNRENDLVMNKLSEKLKLLMEVQTGIADRVFYRDIETSKYNVNIMRSLCDHINRSSSPLSTASLEYVRAHFKMESESDISVIEDKKVLIVLLKALSFSKWMQRGDVKRFMEDKVRPVIVDPLFELDAIIVSDRLNLPCLQALSAIYLQSSLWKSSEDPAAKFRLVFSDDNNISPWTVSHTSTFEIGNEGLMENELKNICKGNNDAGFSALSLVPPPDSESTTHDGEEHVEELETPRSEVDDTKSLDTSRKRARPSPTDSANGATPPPADGDHVNKKAKVENGKTD